MHAVAGECIMDMRGHVDHAFPQATRTYCHFRGFRRASDFAVRQQVAMKNMQGMDEVQARSG